jgi:hypothetical protein
MEEVLGRTVNSRGDTSYRAVDDTLEDLRQRGLGALDGHVNENSSCSGVEHRQARLRGIGNQ